MHILYTFVYQLILGYCQIVSVKHKCVDISEHGKHISFKIFPEMATNII